MNGIQLALSSSWHFQITSKDYQSPILTYTYIDVRKLTKIYYSKFEVALLPNNLLYNNIFLFLMRKGDTQKNVQNSSRSIE